MTGAELLQTTARGEDGRRQFKRDAANADARHVRPPLKPTTADVRTAGGLVGEGLNRPYVAFVLKAAALPGTALHDSRYLDNETLPRRKR